MSCCSDNLVRIVLNVRGTSAVVQYFHSRPQSDSLPPTMTARHTTHYNSPKNNFQPRIQVSCSYSGLPQNPAKALHALHLHRYSDLTHVGSNPRIQSPLNLSLDSLSPLTLCTNRSPLSGEVGKATMSRHADFVWDLVAACCLSHLSLS